MSLSCHYSRYNLVPTQKFHSAIISRAYIHTGAYKRRDGASYYGSYSVLRFVNRGSAVPSIYGSREILRGFAGCL